MKGASVFLQLETEYCFSARMLMSFMKKHVGLFLCGFLNLFHNEWSIQFCLKTNTKNKKQNTHDFSHYFITDFKQRTLSASVYI